MTKISMTYHPVKPDEVEVHRLALLVIQGMIEQAVVSRWGKLDEVWLARSRKEADANQNLFWKAYTIPMDDPERKRNLIRAFEQREKFYYV